MRPGYLPLSKRGDLFVATRTRGLRASWPIGLTPSHDPAAARQVTLQVTNEVGGRGGGM